MLSKSIAFTSFSTDKLLDSFLFYQDMLGLEVELVDERFLHVNLPGGSMIVIYYREKHQAASYTALNFQIKDIESVVDALAAEGIAFLQYDEPIKTDAKGISWDDEGSHLAWFKDPGGNILALIEN